MGGLNKTQCSWEGDAAALQRGRPVSRQPSIQAVDVLLVVLPRLLTAPTLPAGTGAGPRIRGRWIPCVWVKEAQGVGPRRGPGRAHLVPISPDRLTRKRAPRPRLALTACASGLSCGRGELGRGGRQHGGVQETLRALEGAFVAHTRDPSRCPRPEPTGLQLAAPAPPALDGTPSLPAAWAPPECPRMRSRRPPASGWRAPSCATGCCPPRCRCAA